MGGDRVAELEHERELLKLRLAVTRLVLMDMSRWVEDDDCLDLVIDDVVARRLARDPDTDKPPLRGLRECHHGLREFLAADRQRGGVRPGRQRR